MRPHTFVVVVVVTVALAFQSTGCVTTTSSRQPSDADVELRFSTNSERFYSEVTQQTYEPGEHVRFDGFFADGTRLDDELDFYTIVDDKEHIDGIVEWRETHNRAILYSWIGVGVGAAVVGTGVGLLLANGGNDEEKLAEFAGTPLGQGTFGALALGGVLLGGGGMSYFLFGPKHVLLGDGGYDPGLRYHPSESDLIAQRYMGTRKAGAPPAEAPAEPAPASE